jgi:uncharacterized protein involved in response to NO
MAESVMVELRMKGEPGPGRHPWASTGFRSFFAGAAAFAALGVPLWLMILAAGYSTGGAFDGPAWHGHEMLYGYAVAVLAGFFLTAVPKWTGRRVVEGWPLLATFGLWVVGRFAVVLPEPWSLLDVLFLPVLALILGRAIYGAKRTRNYGFPPLLLLMAAANLAWHRGWHVAEAKAVALDVVVVIMIIVGGRIIPMFTDNAVEEAKPQRTIWAEKAINPALVALLAADALMPSLAPLLSLVAGVILFARMARWGGLRTLHAPIVWVLHAGYAWIVLGLILRGLPTIGIDHGLDARHALTAGGIGVLTLGMMSRVALGHSGRPLRVPLAISVAYVVVNLAAITRLLVGSFGPAAVHAAGLLWTAAFAVYFVLYLPILWQPRADGRPG